MKTLLAQFAVLVGKAIFAAALDYLRDPGNRDEIAAAGTFVRDQLTDAIPGEWDDKIAAAITTALEGKLPDFGPLTDTVSKLSQALGRLPNLGGLLGR
jgi:hypothetical protein